MHCNVLYLLVWVVFVKCVYPSQIRLIYASPQLFKQSATASLTLNDTVKISNVGYASQSSYVNVNSGQVQISVNGKQSSEILEPSTIYSVIVFDRNGEVQFLLQADNTTIPSSYKPADAKLVFIFLSSQNGVMLQSLSSICFNCSMRPLHSFNESGTVLTVKSDTSYSTKYKIDEVLFSHEERPHSTYSIYIMDPSSGSDTLQILFLPQLVTGNPYLPIAIAFGIMFGLAFIWTVVKLLYYQFRTISEDDDFEIYGMAHSASDGQSLLANYSTENKKSKRKESLDTFRGMSLAIMIFVNYGGGGYWFFGHSRWNGLTVADLVFPWFIYIMGVSMSLSHLGIVKRKQDNFDFLGPKIISRTLKLFVLGLFLNNFFDYKNARIPGVLQRFSLSYFFVTLIVTVIPPGLKLHHYTSNSVCADLWPFVLQWIVVLLIAGAWVGITFFLPVPGCPTGYLGPGGKYGDHGAYKDAPRQCTAGAAGYIDDKLFHGHYYTHPTFKKIYGTSAYDPEGLLGNLTSIVITFLGYHTGRILLIYKNSDIKILLRWILWGIILIGIAVGLCGASQNNGIIPINKNLWSLSFVLLQSGTGMVLLSICYILVDVFKVWSGTPFLYIGKNSIAIYVGHEILESYFPFHYHIYGPVTHAKALTENLIGAGCWLLIAYLMFRRGVMIKI